MNRKKRAIFAVLSLLVLLAGCSQGSSQSGYVDISETQQKIEKNERREVSDTVTINDRGRTLLESGYNFNGSEFMIWQTDEKKRVDLATGQVSSLCDITGCAHDINTSKGCVEYLPMNSPVMTSDGYYYTLGDGDNCKKLFYKSGGEVKTVFENSYHSELDAMLDPDHKGAFSFMFKGGMLYIMGQNWFYTVDTATMTQTCEPVVIGDSPMWYADASGDDFYMTNENCELWHYDLKAGKLTKIGDKVVRISACADGIYYNRTAGDNRWAMYKSDLQGHNEKCLADGVGSSFVVTEKSIYFTKEDGLYLFDKASGGMKKVALELAYENGERYTLKDPRCISLVSCPSSKYVYLLDYRKETGERCCNALFRITKDTADCEAISLGIWYQPEGESGSIISY